MTERALQRQVLTHLRKVGGLWENRSPSTWGKEGVSDIVGCYRGMFVAIELKAPGRYKDPNDGLTPAQAAYLERVRANGGVAVCTDSLALILRVLKCIDGHGWGGSSCEEYAKHGLKSA